MGIFTLNDKLREIGYRLREGEEYGHGSFSLVNTENGVDGAFVMAGTEWSYGGRNVHHRDNLLVYAGDKSTAKKLKEICREDHTDLVYLAFETKNTIRVWKNGKVKHVPIDGSGYFRQMLMLDL